MSKRTLRAILGIVLLLSTVGNAWSDQLYRVDVGLNDLILHSRQLMTIDTQYSPLGKPKLISPLAITAPTNWPAFAWSAPAGATWYRLYVSDSTGNRIDRWYESARVCNDATCYVAPGTALAEGSASWWIDTWNPNGFGPWSDTGTFTVPAPVTPGEATMVSPLAITTPTNWPAFTWNSASNAAWYRLYVNDSGGNRIDKWYESTQVCIDTTCSVAPGTALAEGSATWWIDAWNPNGFGPWSEGVGFTVPASVVPDKANLLSPLGAIDTDMPTYKWNAVSNSTWYYLWVNDSSGTRIQQWYKSADAGCSGGTGICSITSNTYLSGGSAKWWVLTWNPNGIGLWSDGMEFATPASVVPNKATLVSPWGTLGSSKPSYTWHAVYGSTWYWLYVNGPSGNLVNNWYTAAEANCDAGTGICSVTPDKILANGSYSWWIQTWNWSGAGPWSDAMSFTVGGNAVGFDSEFNGSADGWVGRTGNWSIISNTLTAVAGGEDKYVTAYFQPALFSNFQYQAKIWRSGCEYCTNVLLVRGNPSTLDSDDDWRTTYEFGVDRSGRYSIWVGVDGVWRALQNWTDSSVVNRGDAWNELQVSMDGNNLSFAIIGVWVFDTTESSLTSGYVGVGFYSPSSSGGDQLWVDWARLTPISGGSQKIAENQSISSEQFELNDAANMNCTSLSDRRMSPR
jgi:hypothetical protein